MPAPPGLDVQRIIDNAPLSSVQRKAIALAMAVIFFDGFDALIMAITAPVIAEEWGTTTASLTPAIVAALLGGIVGGLLLAPLADRYGRRPVLITGVAIFATLTLCAVGAQNLEQMVTLRFLAGIGLGAVIPNSYAYGAEFAPKRIRATVVTVVAASTTAGGFIGGLLASAVMPHFGWRSVFLIGGALPLLLTLVLLRGLPETIQFLTLKGSHEKARALLCSIDARAVGSSAARLTMPVSCEEKPSITALFTRQSAPVTVPMSMVYFSAVLLMLFLMSWIPSVLTDAGFSTGQAVFASSIFNLGGMVGGLALGARIDHSNSPYRVLSLTFFVAAIAIVMTAFSLGSLVVLMISLFVVGALSTGTQMCVNAVAAEVYPAALRATGLGFLTAVGRVGSVVGPSIGGALLAAQLPAKSIFLLAVIPAIVAAAAMAVAGGCATSRRVHLTLPASQCSEAFGQPAAADAEPQEVGAAPERLSEMLVEPDYRFTLANERTFLAWQRTALGLLAAAVAVVQFMPELAAPGLRHALGALVGVLAMLTSGAGLHRWRQVDDAMRRDLPLPRPSTPLHLTLALMVIGVVAVALAVAAS